MMRYTYDVMIERNAQNIKSCLGQGGVLSSPEGPGTNMQTWPGIFKDPCKGKHFYDSVPGKRDAAWD